LHLDETKALFKGVIAGICRDAPGRDELAEAAFPAYANRNPVIDWIFWRRLRLAERYVLQSRAQRVLDFGCGSGVMVHCLASAGLEVVGVDVNLAPLRAVCRSIKFPQSASFATPEELDGQCDRFDAILALDVLEHIADLSGFIATAKRLLKTGGAVVVSGPTENLLYRLGRKLAGKEYSGNYHVSDIERIRERLAQSFVIEPIATIYPPLPLFRLFAAR